MITSFVLFPPMPMPFLLALLFLPVTTCLWILGDARSRKQRLWWLPPIGIFVADLLIASLSFHFPVVFHFEIVIPTSIFLLSLYLFCTGRKQYAWIWLMVYLSLFALIAIADYNATQSAPSN